MQSTYVGDTMPNNTATIPTQGVTTHEDQYPVVEATRPSPSGGAKTATNGGKTTGTAKVSPLVMVANDDPAIRHSLCGLLESAGYRVAEVDGSKQAIARMSDEVAVALIDMFTQEPGDLESLRYMCTSFKDTQVIVVSNDGTSREVVAAMRQGAFHCLPKRCDRDELLLRVQQAARTSKVMRDCRALWQAASCPTATVELIGDSEPMRVVRKQLAAFAQLDSTVLITGPVGSGKTLIAQMIHNGGKRSSQPLVTLNCGSLPPELIEVDLLGHTAENAGSTPRPGRLEIAAGGSMLLDQIGQLPLEVQAQLLRFLEQRTVARIGSTTTRRLDVRIIATASRDLTSMCRQGSFRQDLLFRLNVLLLNLPPLSQRADDIPELTRALLQRIATRRGCNAISISNDAMQVLINYDWPGNVRELEDILIRASMFCEGSTIRRRDVVLNQFRPVQAVGEKGGTGQLAGLTLAEIERRALIETLQMCRGNRAKTARHLGVSEKTIYNKIKQFNLTGIV
jgi:DNA-binding NtrC family response regulator